MLSGLLKKLFGSAPNVMNEPQNGKHLKPKTTKGIIVLIIVVFIGFGIGSNCYFDVREQEQAVVTMFGKVLDVKSAGLYFKIPFLQRAHLVDTTTHGMSIGYTGSNFEAVSTHEALMITSDFNFVDMDFYLEYRVSDPVAYLYASHDPEGILYNVTQSSIRATVINYTVDDAITTAKSKIQAEVRDSITERLDELKIGLQVVNVSVQDAEPPTDQVIEAFKAVETAKQSAETAVNTANQYRSEKIPAAKAEADRITQEAEAEKAARIAEAEGQVERFNQMYAEYAKYPFITRQRLYYEAIEDILPGVKMIITDGSTQTMLPLESFVSDNASEDTK